MANNFILAIDEGTTSARAIIYNQDLEIVGIGQREFPQYYPQPGYVEHNPDEIWYAQMLAIKEAMEKAKIQAKQIIGIGVTNQRETTILWDVKSGKPIYNAIVWQDRRTSNITDWLKANYFRMIKDKTGLVPDPYFSGSKIKWILDNIPNAREKAERGEIKFGTIDTYLIWKLTNGKVHITDYSNASRTMLFNINNLEWDSEILELLKIPENILPEVRPSSEIYGYSEVLGSSIPISGDAGDQQAALFGQVAYEVGEVKSTYGTGSFILMNIGSNPIFSENLLTTIAWGLEDKKVTYALEGSIFITGAAVQWFRDGLRAIDVSDEIEPLAASVPDTDGVYFVPAFVGLGAPYWDPYARGLIIGITRGTTKAHIARAILESIAYQTRDVIETMEKDSASKIKVLKVDGGAAKDNLLMQFQADILGIKVIRPKIMETTSMGVAMLAGLAVNYWNSLDELKQKWKIGNEFTPAMGEKERERRYRAWKEAVKRSMGWEKSLGSE
ncbi:glycerol kinase GlpK [Sulfolobus sp. E5-1-F]|uniref:glycerol kinase GlpK n=1 Tax=Sulfolobaceae TaxID=118883 RepID=UPI001297DCDF|nr:MULTISPECIES: glycerol kinase GlpK [unclassified Sulfolobus]QGA53660.1 glycerol kinase GlpK [Sulfolobus sp. E5-1-F]QGA68683.1 glycerol kinase GlpK [Sulfolobus sp. E11-6]